MKRSILAIIVVIGAMVVGATAFFGYRFLMHKKLRSNTIERTLVIIKPDAVKAKNTGKIIDKIEQEGFAVIDLKKIHLDRDHAEQLYTPLKNKSFFSGLIDFMTSGPIVVIILEKINAIADLNDLMGPSDPRKAPEHTLRRQFGTDVRHNGLHHTATQDAAQREIKMFFADRFKM
jgi:nucleoside-diphosphate kinase